MSQWHTLEPFKDGCIDHADMIPAAPGVYAVYQDGQLVYIGQSMNLRKRFCEHGFQIARYSSWVITPWGKCTEFKFKYKQPKKYGEWAMAEIRLIRRLRPIHNFMHNRAARCS